MIGTVAVVLDPASIVDQLLASCESQPYAELAIATAWLRALAQLHQSHHWQAKGDPFYGDHLLYERLYNEVVPEIDRMAEKAVGLGTAELVNPVKLIRLTQFILESIYLVRPGIPQSSDLAVRSLHAEKCFLAGLVRLIRVLDTRRISTPGIENLLGEIADAHESHCYLLKQRIGV